MPAVRRRYAFSFFAACLRYVEIVLIADVFAGLHQVVCEYLDFSRVSQRKIGA